MQSTDNNKITSLFSNKIVILDPSHIEQLMAKKKKIGEGATSIVYKIKNCLEFITAQKIICLKILKNELFRQFTDQTTTSTTNDDDDDFDEQEETNEQRINFNLAKQLYSEYEILNSLHHPNIVKVYGFFLGDEIKNPAIILEYCNSNLEDVINGLADFDLIRIIIEICSAMKYVHEKKIIHRDLKMKNILIKNRHAKICDFGISKITDFTTYTSMTHGIGTLPFTAPEVFNEEMKYTEKVDVYSFGVIMYFILTRGEKPKFTGPGCYEALKFPKIINKLSQNIIKKCWSSSPDRRPSFNEILNMITKNNYLLIDGIKEQISEFKKSLE